MNSFNLTISQEKEHQDTFACNLKFLQDKLMWQAGVHFLPR